MDNQTAVTVSLVSISVSVVGLLWQPTLHGLSGARLRVSLRPAVMTHRGKIVSAPERRWPSRLSGEMVLDGDDLWFEVAHITVSNVGRTAVWASAAGLDFGSESRLPVRNRLTMTLTPIAVAGGSATMLRHDWNPDRRS